MEQASSEIIISYTGVAIATVSAFLLGGLWYSPVVFGRLWMKLNGFTEDDLKSGTAKIFGTSFLLQLVSAVTLAAFLGKSGLVFSLFAGLMVGLLWVGASLGITYLFERKSFKLYLINAGYHILAYTIMGGIIGIFQT